jgi:hypothetical protein
MRRTHHNEMRSFRFGELVQRTRRGVGRQHLDRCVLAVRDQPARLCRSSLCFASEELLVGTVAKTGTQRLVWIGAAHDELSVERVGEQLGKPQRVLGFGGAIEGEHDLDCHRLRLL